MSRHAEMPDLGRQSDRKRRIEKSLLYFEHIVALQVKLQTTKESLLRDNIVRKL